ncbi:MAG TPA: FixH family protein [Candidatus Polarisedimenticolaceae bacterium]|nr:FixH family protein [Candidatus Polarisedimenticolaceae bacterium]
MKRGAHWPVVIVSLLAAGVTANVYLLVRATGDPSFSVEPDSYAKAIAWDAHLAQVARNEALGWRAEVSAGASGVVVRLSDRDGRKVTGATVMLEAFPIARGNQVVRAALEETADHGYGAGLPLARSGLWEFRISVFRGGDTFTAVLDQDVP